MLDKIIAAIVAVMLIPLGTGIEQDSHHNVEHMTTVSNRGSVTVADSEQSGDSTSGRSDASPSGAFPGNPSFSLPKHVASSVPNTAMAISPKYAALPSGTVVDIRSGKKVTDPDIVGTKKAPIDPLSLTNGKRFIAAPVKDVRGQIRKEHEAESDTARTIVWNRHPTHGQSSSSTVVSDDLRVGVSTKVDKETRSRILETPVPQLQPVIDKSPWGPYWSTSDGQRAFFDARNRRILTQARYVIDVSEWQGNINWQAVKNSGVQAAVIRLAFGTTHIDDQVQRNITEVKRLHIPFGVYLYSCAGNASEGRAEAEKMNNILRRYGVSPSDLSLPAYYDVEYYAGAAGGAARTTAVNAWWSRMGQLGWTGRALYANTAYLDGPLNQPGIRDKVGWIAQYGYTLQYSPTSNFYGWQYSSSGRVSGISSNNVDVNAFGYRSPVSSPWDGSQVSSDFLADYRLPNGTYYLNSSLNTDRALMIDGASRSNGARIVVGRADQSTFQKFRFTRQADGSYIITNSASGKALEIYANQERDGTPIDQWDANGGVNQRWRLLKRPSSGRIYLRSELDHRMLDVSGGSSQPGTPAISYSLTGGNNQGFYLCAADDTIPVNKPVKIVSHQKAGMVFDIVGNSRANGALLDLYRWNGGENQQFVFTRQGNGIYRITNVLSGKALDLPGQDGGKGVRPQQYQSNGGMNQQWYILRANDGGYMIATLLTGRVLDIPGAKAVSGASISLWDPDYNANQSWSVENINTPEVPSPSHTDRAYLNQQAQQHRDVLKDGEYSLHPHSAPAMVMDVVGSSLQDGANVMQWSWNSGDNQLWQVSHDSLGYVTLTNAHSRKVLAASGVQTRSGSNIVQQTANGSYSQKWIVSQQAGGFVLLSATDDRLAVDVSGGLAAAGTNIGVWIRTNGLNQIWRFDASQRVLTPRERLDQKAAASRWLIAEGTYTLRPLSNTGLALDVTGNSKENSANVIQWAWTGQPNQRWTVSHDSVGYLTLRNVNSGKVLDVYGGLSKPGTNIDQYSEHNAYGQKWIPERSGTGFVLHSALDDRLVIDVSNMSVTAGANIAVWSVTGGKNQIWRFDTAN